MGYFSDNVIKYFTGSTPGTPKLTPLPVRTPQKVKATVANIPVGSYEGGGRGKERDREKDREREREREREKEREREAAAAAATGHFSFDPESPPTHCAEEPPSSDRPPESSSAGDSSDARNRESTTTKEVRGASRVGIMRRRLLSNHSICVMLHNDRLKLNFLHRLDGRSPSPLLPSPLHQPQNPTCRLPRLIKMAPHPKRSKPAHPPSRRLLTLWTSELSP